MSKVGTAMINSFALATVHHPCRLTFAHYLYRTSTFSSSNCTEGRLAVEMRTKLSCPPRPTPASIRPLSPKQITMDLDISTEQELDIGWSYDNQPVSSPISSVFGNGRVHRLVPPRGFPHATAFSGFEGKTLEETLNPPDADVVKTALTLLIESTKDKNEAYLSKTEQTPDEACNSTGRLSELIKVACEALVREADTQSGDLRREHDASALAYRRRRDAQAAAEAYRHNLLVPINNLPVEVFSNILIFTSARWYLQGLDHIRGIRTLATVGRYWKEVVFSTPQLWSTLQESMTPKQLDLAIERSRTTSLDIQFEGNGYNNNSRSRRESFTASISPYVQRWRSLQAENIDHSIMGPLVTDAKLLQNLRLNSAIWGSSPRVALSDGVRLSSLALTRVEVNWDSTRIQGLTYLSLLSLSGVGAPTLADLDRILALSPDLEVLALSDVFVTPTPPENEIQSMEPFPVFQSLRVLRLVKIPMFAYNHLLSRLRFPNCRSVELEPNPPNGMEWAVDDMYRHDTPIFVEQVKHALLLDPTVVVSLGRPDGTKSVRVNNDGWTEAVEGMECKSSGFSLMLRPGMTSDALRIIDVAKQVTELVRRACPTSALHLYVRLGLESNFPVVCLTGLNDMLVEKISLGGDADIRAVMSYLGQRLESSSGGDGGWPYSGLKRIHLIGSYGNQSVVAIRSWVQERWVKFKDNGSDTRPEGFIEVTMPTRKGGKTELWKPVLKKRKQKTGRRRIRVSPDESDGDDDSYSQHATTD
ncbi:hypothetical protein FRB93_005341 [Tulasnella sp. JGI-2019a]|nr:hypothetical protein FRB93_005341 [Tulasnella sp. JGI-2019a]